MQKPYFMIRIMIAFCLVNSYNTIYAFMNPNLQAVYKNKNFKYEGNRKINTETGQLAGVWCINHGPLTGTPEAMARQFLRDKNSLFGIKTDLADLVHQESRESLGGYHIRFYQEYQGIPIFRSGIVVSINKKHRVTTVMTNYEPNVKLATVKASISDSDAVQIVCSTLKISGKLASKKESTLVILPTNDNYLLVYRVIIPVSEPPGEWEVFVDGLTGAIICITDLIQYANGTGYVFDPDPLSHAGVYYGASGFVNNYDSNSVELTGARTPITLRDITYRNGRYYLEGPYVMISDFDTPWIDPASEINADGFQYTRSHDGVDDVMAY